MRRVLENLTENAIRHAPEGSTVRLRARESEAAVELCVTDAGPGVPAELREAIFQPFVQAKSEQPASRTGRGLGLTFCKLAVEAHGGRIWVEDAPPRRSLLPDLAQSGVIARGAAFAPVGPRRKRRAPRAQNARSLQ